MPKILLFFSLLLTCFIAHSQVGIGTTDPHPDVMLDVNGGLRIRNYNDGSDNAAKDSLVVLDGRGVVHRIATSTLLANMDKSLVKANISSSASSLLSITIGESLIKFDNTEFDIKGEYNSSSGYITIENSGIYRITSQILSSSTISGLVLFGLRLKIRKGGVGSFNTAAETNYTGLSAVPRTISTILELEAGDQIAFYSYNDLSIGVINLSANAYDNYFTIEQVR
ncbi:C1q-like domain-containing protein [Leeuwenhoekiella palythoae]|uniref:C1q domain-containing protein n=1 Tax=Leeuwenhoekiella palythoae TaxID=573501 RepID=A0A1M5XQ27_9FLAO|nr:hypothetical protein [Leeuwenhoekiella palythoae]RXG30183.1 C1q domain-containing protein [Leeuwenhoekiella palythoae]SHI01866.1 C1q domain-containing protein [Leeuwenhoekiella palythoae]